jgi:uncharacterized protein YjbJ (UPF0337 family)
MRDIATRSAPARSKNPAGKRNLRSAEAFVPPVRLQSEKSVNDNQASGIGKAVKGAIKEVTSKVTGNKLGEAEGKIEKNVGKAQTKLGNKQEQRRQKAASQK